MILNNVTILFKRVYIIAKGYVGSDVYRVADHFLLDIQARVTLRKLCPTSIKSFGHLLQGSKKAPNVFYIQSLGSEGAVFFPLFTLSIENPINTHLSKNLIYLVEAL